jgi:hypothetical protein
VDEPKDSGMTLITSGAMNILRNIASEHLGGGSLMAMLTSHLLQKEPGHWKKPH